jgi:hypothetical protein
MPQGRAAITNAVVQHKGKVYVVGGYGGDEVLQSVAVYDVAAEVWSVLPAEMMVNRRGYAAAVHGNKIYVLGGMDEGHTSVRSVEVYDIVTGEWGMVSGEMHVARCFFAAAVHGDTLCAIGGVGAEHTMEVLALPSPFPWIPTRHSTFPRSFKRTVFTVLMCAARQEIFPWGCNPDDLVCEIMWWLDRSAFNQSISATESA